MYEQCLQEAERFLASHKEIIVPVQEVWEQILKRSQHQKFEAASFPDFTALLEGDGRFELLTSEKSLNDGLEEEEGEEAMGELGFLSQDRVKLRRIKIAPVEEEEEVEAASMVRGIGATMKGHVLHARGGTNGRQKLHKERRAKGPAPKTRRVSHVGRPSRRKKKSGKKS